MVKGFEKITFKNGVIEEIGESMYLVKATKENDSSVTKKEKRIYQIKSYDGYENYIEVNEDQERLLKLLREKKYLSYICEIFNFEDLILKP